MNHDLPVIFLAENLPLIAGIPGGLVTFFVIIGVIYLLFQKCVMFNMYICNYDFIKIKWLNIIQICVPKLSWIKNKISCPNVIQYTNINFM